MVTQKPCALSKANCFYELYLLIEDRVELTEEEKYLLGLGQLALESNQLEMQQSWLNGLVPSLGSQMVETMVKVAQLGMEQLFKNEKSISLIRIEEYWSLKEWLEQLNSCCQGL